MPPASGTVAGASAQHMETEEEDLFIGDGDYLEGEDEDINFVNDGSGYDEETNRFDQIVGALEEILMDPDFEDARESFCKQNCTHFEDNDENKLIYTELFSKYTELIESNIESRLAAEVPGFDMGDFLRLLDAHKEELMGDVFDLLLTMGDFEAFKDVMLSYKKEAEHGGLGFEIHCHAMKVCTEEQEDGEERPDLDLGLTISPVSGGTPKKH